MDDILAGANTLEEVKRLKEELIALFMAGGFPLSKWTANDPEILSDVSSDQLASAQRQLWHRPDSFAMLGISWQPSSDAFYFQWTHPQVPDTVTKRKALSHIAQLYDPVGWITPITVRFRIFMQTLWNAKLQWDDPLPHQLQVTWDQLFSQLQQLQDFAVPRWIGQLGKSHQLELHGFSDASERAYAACLYIRTVDNTGNANSILLAAKSKVAPLKQVSLPRLELSGAVLLVRLANQVQQILSL